jgi:hypothetical protein
VGSYSGLDKAQRIRCRDRACQAAWLLYNHRGAVHYTQGARRWEGIRSGRNARKGQFPAYCDCSSSSTWYLWNGLYLGFGMGDVVNGLGWRAGFTGTLRKHGKVVKDHDNILRCDLVLYGKPPNGSHVAMVVSFKGSRPYVISHGSEAGPLFLPYDYRSDVLEVRRYI